MPSNETILQTPSLWVALVVAYDNGVEHMRPETLDCSGLHAGDMAGVLSRVGFKEASRTQSKGFRAFHLKSPHRKMIVSIREVLVPNLHTQAEVIEEREIAF